MKNITKKVIFLLFFVVFSLPTFGMIDSGQDRKVMLSDHYNIEVRESVKKFIEEHDISLETVVDLYSSSIKDPSLCPFSGKAIFVCSNQLIEISILKSDYSIVNIALKDNNENDNN